jgi:hypothetical protein
MTVIKGQRDFKLLRGGKYSRKKLDIKPVPDKIFVKKLTRREKDAAAFFPLFGKPVRDLEALNDIVSQHCLACVKFEDIDEILMLSVRSQNCLRNAKIRRFDKLLMMTPDKLQAIKNFSKRCLGELQEAVKHILGIE